MLPSLGAVLEPGLISVRRLGGGYSEWERRVKMQQWCHRQTVRGL